MPLRISKNRVQLDSVPMNLAAEVDVASAATTNIGAALSNNVRITGTTTITSFGTADAGITRTLRFADSLTLTYNATSLILPGGVSITTAANDTAEMLSLGSGNWFCKAHNVATGTYLPANSKTVDQYGATGDGTTNDAPAIIAAITAAGVGGTIVFSPGKTYLVDTRLTLLSGQTVIGYGATIKRAAQTSTTTTTTITSGATSSIVVADPSAFRIGGWINVLNGASYDTSGNKYINNIVGSTVSITGTFGVSVSGTTTVYSSFVLFYTVGDNSILGFAVDGNRTNYSFRRWEATAEINVYGSRNLVKDCYLYDSPGEGIMEGGATIATLKTGNVYTDNYVYNTNGNGVHFSGSFGTKVTNNVFDITNLDTNVGHQGGCVTFSATCFGLVINNNFMRAGLAGVGQMAGWDNSWAKITNNTIINCTSYGIDGICGNQGSAPDGFIITNNTITNCSAAGTAIAVGNTAASVTVTPTGSVDGSTPYITALSSYTNVRAGNSISGTGIPTNSIILYTDGATLTIGDTSGNLVNTTAAGTPTLTIAGRLSTGGIIAKNTLRNSGRVTGGSSGAIVINRVGSCTVEGNTVEFLPTDITSYALYYNSVSSNLKISGNTFINGKGHVQGSINGAEAGGKNISIIGNSLHDPDSTGIDCRPTATPTNVLISGNTCSCTAAHNAIIWITPCVRGRVTNNHIDAVLSTWGRGIRVNAIEGCIVQGNFVRLAANTTATIEITAASTNYWILNNQVTKAIVDTAAVGTVRDTDLIPI